MSQEIEIEYKVVITKEMYETLAKALPFPEHAAEQINYYFETPAFDLKQQKSALRIRKKNNAYQLTLKETIQEGILETHDRLTEAEYKSWINGAPIPKSHVHQQLNALKVSERDLHYFGSLTTYRKTFTRNEIEYVLDKSTYNGHTDYELEIEAPTKEIGFDAFTSLMEQYEIPAQKPITKIERFFQTLD